MLLVPLLVGLILAGTAPTDVAAGIVFALGATTDLLDGYLARRWNVSTRTGQWLDPLADKLFVTAPVVTLAAVGRLPVWAAVLILVREAAVTGLRIVLGTRGQAMPASRIAKWKTTAQLLAILLYILPLPSGADGTRIAILLVASALTVYTGADYAIRAIVWMRAGGDGRWPGPDGGG